MGSILGGKYLYTAKPIVYFILGVWYEEENPEEKREEIKTPERV
jgi:hypothetical protein